MDNVNCSHSYVLFSLTQNLPPYSVLKDTKEIESETIEGGKGHEG